MAATFQYRVRDNQGRLLQGSLDGDSQTLVADKLRQMGYVPIAIQQESTSKLQRDLKIPGISDRVNQKDVAVFSRQFATMINSGLSLIRALHILTEQTENKVLANVSREVRMDVEKGASLSQALARHPKVFNRLFVAMVRAGETGGVLDRVLVQLADIIEKQVELKRKIKSAMTYPVAVLFLVLLIAMVLTPLYGWTVERIAYRPLRGSFRLAPLISAIGMSIFLSNFVQVTQGPRNKSIPPLVRGEFEIMNANGYAVTLSFKQLIIWGITAVLLVAFWYLVAKTQLGRAQRACEQDQKMAALVGVNVDRTISMTFVIAAALAAVAGTMYLMYYGVVSFADGFVPGVKAFTAAVLGGIGSLPGAVIGGLIIGLIETMWSAYFSIDYKDVAAFSILAITLIFLPQGLLGRPEVEKV